MEKNNNLIMLWRYIRSKIWIVALIGIIFGGGLYWERGRAGTYLIETGNIEIGRILYIQNYKDKIDVFRYDQYASRDLPLMVFVNQSEKKFDYSQFDASWDKKTEIEKLDWAKKHIRVNYYGHGHLDATIQFLSSDTKNVDYIRDYGDSYLSEFINYLNEAEPESQLVSAQSIEIYPEKSLVTNRRIGLKYALMGFVLGSLSATVVLSIVALKVRND